MSDRLLRELGEMVRSEPKAEEARFGDRWDHLAAGTLTAEEEAELKALADSSPEDHEAYEAFRPLGADFQARVVSAINADRAGPATAAPRPEPQEPHPRVLPFRPIVRRAEVWVGVAAAMAAGVFLMVQGSAPQPLPGYVAELKGGFKESRGSEIASPDRKPVFTQGSPFKLELSPKESLEHAEKVKPGVFLSSSTGHENLEPLRGLEEKFEAVETGSVRLDARMGVDIKVKPGDWILWTVVARKSLPKAQEIETRLRAHQPRDTPWQIVCDALRQEEKPPPPPSSWQVTCVDFHTEG